MQEDQAAPVVYRFRPTRSALLAGLAGLIAVAFGLLAPLSAQAGDNSGKGSGNSDKPWICHPVKGHGESGKGYNVIRPDENSSHIDEKSGKGKHEGRNGKTDSYAKKSGDSYKCETSRPTHKPTHTKPTHKPTHTKPTHKPRPHPTTTTETTTSTVTTTTTTTVTTPATPATTPPPETPATVPPVVPAEPPEEAPFVPEEAPVAAPVAEPQAAPVVENVVPQAATDGADLVATDQESGAVRGALLAAGALLLLAAGLLTARRSQSD
jgi:hypothetical protein